MKRQRIAAVAYKEWLHIRRDPRSLILAVATPLILLGLFGWALSLDLDRIPLAVWDRNHTPASRQLISRFEGSPYFQVRPTTGYAALERAIDRGEVRAALVIPERDLTRLQLLVDGADPTVGSLVLGYADAVVSKAQHPPTIEVRPRVWYNPDMVTRNAIVPGLIATILAMVAALLTSLTIAREWETGTMETLIATPVTGPELIIGKLAPYFAIGVADVLLAMAMAQWVFEVPLRGSPLFVLLGSLVFLGATLGQGILISVVARGQLLASQMAFMSTLLPAFLLSGLVFAIADMPRPLQVLSSIFPARYFVTLLRAIYLKGLGPAQLAWELGLLSLFMGLTLGLAMRIFRKQLV
jgi:ABC-2 type transport system permease protein